MTGRHVTNNKLIFGMLDDDGLMKEGFLLFLDYFKAFHAIEHNVIFKTLENFGFGEVFIKTIKSYTDTVMHLYIYEMDA